MGLFRDWAMDSLSVRRDDISARIVFPFGERHPKADDVDRAGVSWSFPQALAWIATRKPFEVARFAHFLYFGPPVVDKPESAQSILQSEEGRRQLLGWLVLQTALDHCQCGSKATADREKWEKCQCVGTAFDTLARFVGSSASLIEFRAQPDLATFALTWPVGADGIRLRRAEVIEHWPAPAALPHR